MDIILKECDQDDLLSLCEDNYLMRKSLVEFLDGLADESREQECDRCNQTDKIHDTKVVNGNIETKLIDREVTLCSKCYHHVTWEL